MPRTFQEIRDDMLQAAVTRGIASYMGSGGVAKELLQLQAYGLADASGDIDQSVSQAFILGSSGNGKDRHGADLQLPRLQQHRAFTRTTDRNIRFYVESGTFASNGVVEGEIAVGANITGSSGGIAYLVNEVETLANFDSANEIYVGAQGIQPGAAANISQGILQRHSLSNPFLRVTNSFPISNGRNREADTQYQARLENQIRALEACNDAAVTRNTFIVPGIGKVNIIRGYRGAGSTGIIVQPSIGIVTPASLVAAIESSVSSVMPQATELVVKAPELISVSFESVLRTTDILNATEKQVVIGRVERALTDYLNGYQIGDHLIVRALASEILNADNRLASFGTESRRPDIIRYSITDGVSSYDDILSPGLSRITVSNDELVVLDSSPYNFSIL